MQVYLAYIQGKGRSVTRPIIAIHLKVWEAAAACRNVFAGNGSCVVVVDPS